MKIGIVGYQGSGKSTLFHWLTGVAPDPSLAHTTQAATAEVPDKYIEPLCKIYSPKKVTLASVNIVDTPGLSRDHQGSAGKLALIREAGCLVVVVGAFSGAEPIADLRNFEDDLLLADLDILSGRVERLRESVKKPRPNREKEQEELAALEPLVDVLEQGTSLRDIELTTEQNRAIKSFQLFSQKPRLVVINLPDDETDLNKYGSEAPGGIPLVSVSISLQMELSKMSAEERAAFCEEMSVSTFDAGDLLRKMMEVSGQMLFYTAGEPEVRTWMLRRGGTAEEAAGGIHTDLARGFIRAETMNVEDLIRLGSEREIKAHNLLRKEPKDYVVQDGDILHILSNV